MTTAYAPAPASITPRDMHFDVDRSRIADWADGDLIRSTWGNALSLLFPIGERFFISSVLQFKHVIEDPAQLEAVKAFAKQEGLHTREHLDYNQLMRHIVDVDLCEARQAKRMSWVKKNVPALAQLAATCAAEHFTAIMAHDLLKHPEERAGIVESYSRLWTWHAIEECEHKSVAFDVYAMATKGQGHRMRRITMLSVTWNFVTDGLKNSYQFFKVAGTHRSPKTWAKMFWYLVGKPGVLRRVLPEYLQYYKKSFHPSDIDDSRELAAGIAYLSLGTDTAGVSGRA